MKRFLVLALLAGMLAVVPAAGALVPISQGCEMLNGADYDARLAGSVGLEATFWPGDVITGVATFPTDPSDPVGPDGIQLSYLAGGGWVVASTAGFPGTVTWTIPGTPSPNVEFSVVGDTTPLSVTWNLGCTPADPPADTDGDGVPDASDNCPDDPNPDQVDSDADGVGDVCDDSAAGPGGDYLAAATEIASLPVSVSQPLVKTDIGAVLVPCGTIGTAVWFKYTPPANAVLVADTFASSFDTVLAVYTDSGAELVACNDDAGVLQSEVAFRATAGTTYWFQVGGWGTAVGSLVFNLGVAPGPLNNYFVVATSLSLGASVTVDTAGADMELGELQPSCASAGSTVWFSFTPSSDVRVVADTSGSDFDTVLEVYAGSWPNLLRIPTGGCVTGPAEYRMLANANTTLWFQVGGLSGETGNLVFNLSGASTTYTFYVDADGDGYGGTTTVVSDSPTPVSGQSLTSNDCDDANASVNPGAVDIPGDGIDQDCSGADAHLYYVDADGDGYGGTTTVVSDSPTPVSGQSLTSNDCDDTNASVNPGAVDIPGDGIDQDCSGADAHLDSDSDGVPDTVDNCVEVANPDQADIDGDGIGDVCDPPVHGDNFVDATDLSSQALPASVLQSTEGATVEDGEPLGPDCIYQFGSTVWYSYTPTEDVTLTADTIGSNFDTGLAVYTGSWGSLAAVTCNDDIDLLYGIVQSRVEFAATASTTYWFQVGGFDGRSGGLVFNLDGEVETPPANDNFASAFGLTSLPASESQTTQYATFEEGERQPSCGASIGATVWYSYTPTEGVILTADTIGSSFDTVLAVYTGTWGSLAEVDCDDDSVGSTSLLEFSATAGETYWFQVGGYGGGWGDLVFNLSGASTTYTFYVDADGDGYGGTTTVVSDSPTPVSGQSLTSNDCDDANASVNPGAVDIPGDGIDQDCSGADAHLYYVDADGDGYGGTTTVVSDSPTPVSGQSLTSNDCDDANASVNPGAVDIPGDGIDQDCSGADAHLYYVDADGDGYGGTTTVVSDSPTPVSGQSLTSNDCDDTNASVNPGAVDIPGDGIDQDCSGADAHLYYVDADGDGYGGTTTVVSDSPTPVSGQSLTSNDCDDTNASVNPGAVDIPGDGIDQDCSGADAHLYYVDADGDGYGGTTTVVSDSPTPVSGQSLTSNDCDDTNASVNPGAVDIPGDGIDQDCSGADAHLYYVDADGDGYGGTTTVVSDSPTPVSGQSLTSNDCDDANASVNPGAVDIPGDGIDQDCSGADAHTDNTPPVITPTVVGALGSNGWYTSDVTVSWTVTDDGSPITSSSGCGPAKIRADTSGTTFTCTAASAGGTNSESVTVKRDATGPGIVWNGAIDDHDSFQFGSVPTKPTCTATDGRSGPNGCTVAGYATTVGSYTLTATAYDLAGNAKVKTRTYSVKAWTLRGFYSPVDMGGVWNVVKGGLTVPLRFQVYAGRTRLTDVRAIKEFSVIGVACPVRRFVADNIEWTTSGGTSLRYSGGEFIQNWRTPNLPGACYRVVITTQDGSQLTANFKLR